jgi:2-polyprenyl-3-methyl-5-hydroxy-6-metoxy-1,4-benzoquinol methylase
LYLAQAVVVLQGARMADLLCNLCGKDTPHATLERAAVHSNVRAFKAETFNYVRCAHCHSLHARDPVDLAYYYAQYPYHHLPDDFMLRAMHSNYLGRLRRCGLKPSDTILDFGCGGGHFVRYLRSQGYNARGFDEYSADYADRSALDDRYDCIISQDVIEHVPAPHELLEQFARLIKPAGLISLGTPDATTVDLQRPQDFQHVLHAPYHRHILSRDALVNAGGRQGWKLARFYPTHFSNTGLPLLNERFYLYYTNLADGTIDSLLEKPLRFGPLLRHAPETLFWGCFGGLLSRNTEVMAVFRTS